MALTSANEILGLADKVKEIAVPIESLSASYVTVNLPDFTATNAADAFEELKQNTGGFEIIRAGSVTPPSVGGTAQPGTGSVIFDQPLEDTNYLVLGTLSDLNTPYIGDTLTFFIGQRNITGFTYYVKCTAGSYNPATHGGTFNYIIVKLPTITNNIQE